MTTKKAPVLPKTDMEILHDLVNNAENEEQVRYLTRQSDAVKDDKIKILTRDLGEMQNRLGEANAKAIAYRDLLMSIYGKDKHEYC